MGKKNKDEAPNPNNVVNRDILQRLNFLYQASAYLESVSRQCRGSTLAGADSSGDQSEPPVDDLSTLPIAGSSALPAAGTLKTLHPTVSGRKRHREQRKGRVIRAADIGQGHRPLCCLTSAPLRDPTVKRTLCRGCDTVLIPGLSATVRVNSSNNHRHLITTSCLRCKLSRHIPAPPVLKLASVPHEITAMDVDGSGDSAPPKSRRRRRRRPPPRLPPLFEREGHIIFRGNEQIKLKQP
ncbi:hypothetical protein BJV78DRAFT_1168913 [Lactifluus subvellereus]|nr:hypothetical protein BJV78DRAFT_1168913 [Lactifluus subvellereus]